MAVDTLGHVLALHVTTANDDDRPEVGRLAKAIQVATDQNVELAYVDQGYAGDRPATAAKDNGIALEALRRNSRGLHVIAFACFTTKLAAQLTAGQ